MQRRVPSPDAGAYAAAPVATDVSELERAEEAPRPSEARLTPLVDGAMDAIYAFDAEIRIVLWNRAAERVFRCPAADALGTPIPRRRDSCARVAGPDALLSSASAVAARCAPKPA